MKTPVVRFLTAGSVDDGKSTLIGRLLYDTNSLPQDQIEEVKSATDESFANGDMDFSLYLDGLSSERAQKITIDVAYRYFSYENQKFIIVDAPGHEQYTKNMAVAAGNCEAIIVLIDATQGLQPQTIRHTLIANLFGIKQVVVAINKMDLVDFNEDIFNTIKKDYLEQIKNMSFEDISFVPIVAVNGDNILHKSKNMAWYNKDTIISHLQKFDTKSYDTNTMNLQIQQIVKHNKKRYYQGMISSGHLKVGDSLIAYPANQKVIVESIINSGKESDNANANNSISVTLDREIDLDRGGLLRSENNPPLVGNKFNAKIVFFSESKLDIKKQPSILMKINHQYIRTSISNINTIFDGFNQNNNDNIEQIYTNQVADIDLLLSDNIAIDKFANNTYLGSFLLIDKNSNETIAGGIIVDKSLREDLEYEEDRDIVFLKNLVQLANDHFGDKAKKFFSQYKEV